MRTVAEARRRTLLALASSFHLQIRFHLHGPGAVASAGSHPELRKAAQTQVAPMGRPVPVKIDGHGSDQLTQLTAGRAWSRKGPA